MGLKASTFITLRSLVDKIPHHTMSSKPFPSTSKYMVGLEAGQLGVVTLGGVLDLDGRELAAVRGGWREG
jgi:hypothetical protein